MESPQTWIAPHWHPDLGDAAAECDHLRTLAIALNSISPEVRLQLEVPEPGYMYLEIHRADGTRAEVYSLARAKEIMPRRYGIFLEPGTAAEQEFYADTVEHALDVLARHPLSTS